MLGLSIDYGLAFAELARTLWVQQLFFGIVITSLLEVAAAYDV
ncbi:hypothetical protein [Mycobacterium leprae]|nr:hypothetical protein [Mycobacterium leprae]